MLLATMLGVTDARAEGAYPATVGPSMRCVPKPIDALSLLSCSDAALARADLRMVQTYYAKRGAAAPDARKAMKTDFLNMIVATRRACGLPPVAPGTNQSNVPLPPGTAACVAAAYDRQRDTWLSTLSGPAAEEAGRAPERNVALQGKLEALGFLPRTATLDGIYGSSVRDAISRWQTASVRPATGFISDADAAVLDAASVPSGPAASPETDPLAEYRAKALAKGSFEGAPLTLTYENLSVVMDVGDGHDPAVCRPPFNGGLGFELLDTRTAPASCKAIRATMSVDGKVVHEVDLAAVDRQTDIKGLSATMAIRRLDPATPVPQVVFTAYSGGAHCCTSTFLVTETKDGKWSDLSLGSMDGDQGFGFLDVPGSDRTILESTDGRFDYAFASYAGSYTPERLQVLSGTMVSEVTRDPRYRAFMVHQLRIMENEYRTRSTVEPNGYYAAWVAQKALIGQFDAGWHDMLASYDRSPQPPGAMTICAIDEKAWPKQMDGDSSCPPDQELSVPFPEALAMSLVDMGYVTEEQAKAVGVDVPKVKAERIAARTVATQTFEDAAQHSWFLLSNTGTCLRAETPSSPADLVVLQRGDDGKPTVVRIGEPRSGGLKNRRTFYRGASACEAARRNSQSRLHELR